MSGAAATLVAAGTCTIVASQPGNTTYSPAASVTQSFAVASPNSVGGGGGGGGGGGAPVQNLVATPFLLTYNVTGPAPISMTTVLTSNAGPQTYRVLTGADASSWLRVSPSTGSLPADNTLTVTVNPAMLSRGTYTTLLSVVGTLGTGQIEVTVSVPPLLIVSPSSLSFSYLQGGNGPAPTSVNLTTNLPATTFNLAASTNSGGNWLQASPLSGSAPATITATVAPASLAP